MNVIKSHEIGEDSQQKALILVVVDHPIDQCNINKRIQWYKYNHICLISFICFLTKESSGISIIIYV